MEREFANYILKTAKQKLPLYVYLKDLSVKEVHVYHGTKGYSDYRVFENNKTTHMVCMYIFYLAHLIGVSRSRIRPAPIPGKGGTSCLGMNSSSRMRVTAWNRSWHHTMDHCK
jgi:hypothetical protein